MNGFVAFIDDFVTGSVRSIWFLGLGCIAEIYLAFANPINYLCLLFGIWFGILFVLNVYSWDYQRRHSGQQGEEE